MGTNKAKGTQFESAVVKLFEEAGFTTCRRVVMHGSAGDQGDIWLGDNPTVPSVVVECKSRNTEVAYKGVEDFLNEAEVEYCNACKVDKVIEGKALVFIKRPNLGPQDGYLVWKNQAGLILRARIKDVIDKAKYTDCNTESERLEKLQEIILPQSIVYYTKKI